MKILSGEFGNGSRRNVMATVATAAQLAIIVAAPAVLLGGDEGHQNPQPLIQTCGQYAARLAHFTNNREQFNYFESSPQAQECRMPDGEVVLISGGVG